MLRRYGSCDCSSVITMIRSHRSRNSPSALPNCVLRAAGCVQQRRARRNHAGLEQVRGSPRRCRCLRPRQSRATTRESPAASIRNISDRAESRASMLPKTSIQQHGSTSQRGCPHRLANIACSIHSPTATHSVQPAMKRNGRDAFHTNRLGGMPFGLAQSAEHADCCVAQMAGTACA